MHRCGCTPGSAHVPPEPAPPSQEPVAGDLRTDNERLKLLLDLNNAIVSNLDLRDLLHATSASVRRVMKCDSVGVALPNPADRRLRIHAVDFPEGRGLIREEG